MAAIGTAPRLPEFIQEPAEQVLLEVAGRAPRAVKVMREDRVTKAVALRAVEASEYALALLPNVFRRDPDVQRRAYEFHGLKALRRIKKTLAGPQFREKMRTDLERIVEAMAAVDGAVDACGPEMSVKLDGCLRMLEMDFKAAREIPFSECDDARSLTLAWDVVGWRDMRGRITRHRSLPTCELVEVVRHMAEKWARLLVGKHISEIE